MKQSYKRWLKRKERWKKVSFFALLLVKKWTRV